MRKAFTLIEMTIVIAIIAILSAMALSVYNTAAQQAKGMRTRAIIAKVDQLIGEKYEGYRTRQVPIRIAPGTQPNVAAQIRLDALRELMRFEMPDRITDVAAGPAYGTVPDVIPQVGYPVYPLYRLSARPAINKQYLRRAFKAHSPGPTPYSYGLQYWTTQHENAECLYLILACSRDNDKSALDYFSPTEIGDVDDDGMNEILDSWGQPIMFLRWAPGYRADLAPFPVTPQDGGTPDPFDPLLVYGSGNFALKPLIWSIGPDKINDISIATTNYAITSPPNDPYYNGGTLAGAPTDFAGDGLDHADNITNHDLEAR
jgi:prepilin-type N-terminal cleavage/methylation domain-containing protein